MSIIVDFSYDYWGDNGRCTESKLEEFDSEAAAISDLGFNAYHYAIDNAFRIDRVLGGEEGAVERITEGVTLSCATWLRANRVSKLKRDIASAERWLDNVEAETARHKQSIVDMQQEILELAGL